MIIGALFDITFQTSSNKVLTFDNMTEKVKHKYAEHEILNSVPKLESVGVELREVTFDIILMADFGNNVLAEIKRLQKYCREGKADYLIIGNEVVGECMFVIESVDTTEYKYLGDTLIGAKVKLALKEYFTVGDY